MVSIDYCPDCGQELIQGAKSPKAVVTCQGCGDIYVDLRP